MGYFDINTNSPGALITKLSIDTSQLDSLILNIVGGLMTVISTYLISIILGLQYDWKMTLILSLFVPISVYGMMKKGDYEDNGNGINKKAQIEAGSFLSECVINTKTIFSFNFNKKAEKKYSNILNSETKNFLKSSLLQGFWIGFGLGCHCIAYGVKLSMIFIRKRTLNFENLACVVANITNSMDGLTDILRNVGDTSKARLSFISVFDTLDTKSNISAFDSQNKDKKDTNELLGKIEFKNVCFSYPTKIDGINIKEYNLFELRKKIGLVSQEPSIFKRNIYENILYGKLDASEEEVLNAAKNADINNLLNDENKDNPLSGGEKQRVAIARAFLKNPSIILLDEATSALDKETENEVQKNIIKLQKGKTCITVAHRLSTIIESDIIFVLDSGEIVEKGTHEELLKLKGKYYTL